jgi:hypothetical protein
MRGAAWLLLLGGCGFGIFEHDPNGGGASLPTQGAGPYGRLDSDLDTPAAEPFVVADDDLHLSDAACRSRGGGGYRIWFTMLPDDATEAAIGLAEIPDLHELPDVEPHQVLAGPAAAPSLVDHDGELLVYFERDGGIWRARSDDDGASFAGPTEILADAARPSAVVVDDVFHLFFERDGAIWVAAADDGVDFGAAELALAPRPDVAEAFDAAAVGDPYVLVEISDAGRAHWGLWYTATGAGDPEEPDAGPEGDASLRSIGYAGSFDGRRWERFDGGAEPVLVSPAAAPCVVLEGSRGVMFFQETRNLRSAIAAATHP